MSWQPAPKAGVVSGLDWSQLVTSTGWDPYLAWADVTGGVYLQPGSLDWVREGLVPVAVRCRAGNNIGTLLATIKDVQCAGTVRPGIWISKVYGYKETICSAIVALDAATLTHLNELAEFELCLPGLARIPQPVIEHAFFLEAHRLDRPLKMLLGAEPKRVVLGVIDGCFPVAHPNFYRLNAAGQPETRITAYWSQQKNIPAAGADWHPTDKLFGYGFEIEAAAINVLLGQLKQCIDAGFDPVSCEQGVYQKMGIDIPSNGSHGAAVLDLVAGNPDPRGSGDPGADELVLVSLPDQCLADTGGNWASFYVMDAIRYVVERAGPDAIVVVNLSLGALAGPHDGLSILEAALDDVVAQAAGRLHIVVSAGNFRASLAHARICLPPKGKSELPWGPVQSRNDLSEAFLELWSPQRTVNGVCPTVNVTLSAPNSHLGHLKSPVVAPGEAVQLVSEDLQGRDKTLAMVYNAPTRDNAGSVEAVPLGSGAMVLVGWGATEDIIENWPRAPSEWNLTIENPNDFAMCVDAWLERRDIPTGNSSGGVRAEYKFDPGLPDLKETDTLGSVASGANTYVVGAQLLNTWRMCAFSSGGQMAQAAGPEVRNVVRHAPDLSATGGAATGDPGWHMAGFLSGNSNEQSLCGTSLAAPQVARRIVSLLASELRPMTKQEVLQALQNRSTAAGVPSPSAADLPFSGDFFL